MDGVAHGIARGSCPACGGDGTFLVRQNGFDIYSCVACRTGYVFPQPTEAFLRDYYQGQNRYYFDKVPKKLRRSRNRLRWLKWFGRGGQFLDIGCHGGFTCEAAREAGFDASGIDLDDNALAYAREHYPRNRYHNTPLVEFARGHAGTFALIHCAEVVEHVPDGKAFADAVFALLRPGGYFYLTTPDISHWRRPRKLADWSGLVPPDHLIFYNPASLKRLLRQAGFAIVFQKRSMKPQLNVLARKPA
jgi:2-polyprenyl-3-methyl-5-hydroxy-6-metoxy-1,4-benzoquinol methylase